MLEIHYLIFAYKLEFTLDDNHLVWLIQGIYFSMRAMNVTIFPIAAKIEEARLLVSHDFR